MTPVAFVLLTVVALASETRAPSRSKAPALPPEATAAIQRVTDAAKKGDLKALRAAMVQRFTWSFGGDDDADQAIEEWSKEPRFLRELVRVLRMGCRPWRDTTDRVECPGRGDMSFRAGFLNTEDGWKLEHFVEGD